MISPAQPLAVVLAIISVVILSVKLHTWRPGIEHIQEKVLEIRPSWVISDSAAAVSTSVLMKEIIAPTLHIRPRIIKPVCLTSYSSALSFIKAHAISHRA
jgi:hypothetical protein